MSLLLHRRNYKWTFLIFIFLFSLFIIGCTTIISDPIFKAIEENNTKKVVELLKEIRDLEKTKSVSRKKLEEAMPYAKEDIDYGAKMTPLQYAIFLNNYDLVKLLLKENADPNILVESSGTDNNYGNALNLSVLLNRIRISEMLLTYDVDKDIIAGWGTPLHTAARYGFVDQIYLLVEAGAYVNSPRNSSNKVLSVCYIEDLNPNVLGFTPLHWAIVYDRYEVANALLEARANPNISGKLSIGHLTDEFTPLTLAAMYGMVKYVELLLSAGANKDLDKALYEASFYGELIGKQDLAGAAGHEDYQNAIRLLVNTGAVPNEQYILGTSFERVISEGNDIETVKLLIERGANINQVGNRGLTPLHRAVEDTYNTELVELLLRSGANPNLQTDIGVTPLHLAAFHNKVEIVKILLDYGANKSLSLSSDAAINTYRDNNYYNPTKSKSASGKTAIMLTSSEDIKKLLR